MHVLFVILQFYRIQMPSKHRKGEDQAYTGKQTMVYSKYSKTTKEKLIRLVFEENKKIKSAAKICKMNESTAKMSLKAYKENYKKEYGEYPQRKLKNTPQKDESKKRSNQIIKIQESEQNLDPIFKQPTQKDSPSAVPIAINGMFVPFCDFPTYFAYTMMPWNEQARKQPI